MVIGEAARLVSEATRRRAPSIPWPQIVGARHIMTHEYWRVDFDAVWRIVGEELPQLLRAVDILLGELDRQT